MMVKRVFAFVNELRLARKAAKLCKQGEQLYRAERIDESISALLKAVMIVGEPQENSTALGVQMSINVSAVTFLAYAYAKRGDVISARVYVAKGLRLIERLRLHIPEWLSRDENLRTWEQWARKYEAPTS